MERKIAKDMEEEELPVRWKEFQERIYENMFLGEKEKPNGAENFIFQFRVEKCFGEPYSTINLHPPGLHPLSPEWSYQLTTAISFLATRKVALLRFIISSQK